MMNCVEFHCYDLNSWDDSLLYKTTTDKWTNQIVAEAIFTDENSKEHWVKLIPYGRLSIVYNGQIYTNPDTYPEELTNLIKSHKGDWTMWVNGDEGIKVRSWNYYAYVVDDDAAYIAECQYPKSYSMDNLLKEMANSCEAYIKSKAVLANIIGK